MSIFSFTDDNFSKYQWIIAKLVVCIDIMMICLGLLMGKFCQFLTGLSARDMSVFSFLDNNFSKYQWILIKLGMCIASILWRSALMLLMGKSSIFFLRAYIFQTI